MSQFRLMLRYLGRRKLRTACTVLGVAATVLLFVLLQTIVAMWENGAAHAAKDRLYTRNKVSFALQVPRRYVDDVARVPGVQAATWAVWMALADPRQPKSNFASYAVDAATVFDVYNELEIAPAERQAWLEDPQGIVLGDALARRMNVKPGDRVNLQGTLYPGTWQFRVAGIYHASRRSFDEMSLMMHWKYLDESRRAGQRGQIGWVTSRVDDPARSAAVAEAIDARFADKDIKTSTMNERAANEAFLSFMTAILTAVKGISVILLVIMALVLGNAVAMGTRECTRDYATLRALGFGTPWIVRNIFAQALGLALAASALGLLLARPLIDGGMGRFIEENMTALFPSFHLQPATAVQAAALVCGAALLAASWPVRHIARMSVIDSLRKVV